jgi:hypothetical protein
MPNLDPNPANLLGKGILAPAEEARLLARGVVYAERVTMSDGQSFLATSVRPWKQACVALLRSIIEPPNGHMPVPREPIAA